MLGELLNGSTSIIATLNAFYLNEVTNIFQDWNVHLTSPLKLVWVNDVPEHTNISLMVSRVKSWEIIFLFEQNLLDSALA